MLSPDEVRKAVAHACIERYVKPGMVVGLGTGRTARHLVERIAALYHDGSLAGIKCVPTSEQTKMLAESLGVPLTTLDEVDDDGCGVDVAVDGCDELEERSLHLVKGRGGALLREKVVASAAKKFIVVAEDSKIVPPGKLGTTGRFPVEIVHFASEHTKRKVLSLPAMPPSSSGSFRTTPVDSGDPTPSVTSASTLFVSDNGNLILDLLPAAAISDPQLLAHQLSSLAGVVEHGLFLGMATEALIGKADGSVITMAKSDSI